MADPVVKSTTTILSLVADLIKALSLIVGPDGRVSENGPVVL